ncbi:M48 family metallopeptidase [Dyella sp.]|uniref:M48 family metallopeptidase n=1 Tax=Dyella sp. TaxID=1869338 RepID=UPI002ED0B4A7
MDFFAQQARVRASSRRMVVLFVLAVISIVVTVDLVVWVFLVRHGMNEQGWAARRALPLTTVGMLAVIGGCALFRIASLASGGKAVAEGMGALPVPPDTADPALRQLRNVIEEVAIASGTPVPDIYVMPDEPGINAFAAGFSVSDAAVCVTGGCLDHLTRDELQGVIAHEFSHVVNGDMRLNIRLIGMLFGIMALAIIGRQLIYFSPRGGSNRRGTDGVAVLGLALVAVGYIGYFFGRLIQASVARSRESLADASAVQFTRQTSGIAGALKKIAALGDGSRLHAANRHEVAHMLFGDADAPSFFDGLYATHPPLIKRIRALDPAFREGDLEGIFTRMQQQEDARDQELERESPVRAAERGPIPFIVGAAIPPTSGRVGPLGDDLRHAAPPPIKVALPTALTTAAQQPESAMQLMLALSMAAPSALRDSQRRLAANAFGDDMVYAIDAMAGDVASLQPGQKTTLFALAFPALKRVPEGRLGTFMGTLDGLARTGGDVALDDFCFMRLLRMQLGEAMRPRSAPVDGQKKLTACIDSASLVIAVLAAYGATDEAAAKRAWMLGLGDAYPGSTRVWQPLPTPWQDAFGRALDDLDGLMPPAKEIFVQALLRAIRADGTVTPAELNLLRVICAGLHCVMPLQEGM